MSTKDKLADEESFVSRWSRRKTSEKPADTVVVDDQPEAPAIPLNTVMPIETKGVMQTGVEADRLKAELDADGNPAPVLTDEDMPDIDSLEEGSDFTGFMSPGVSDKLRKLALRKLFAGAGFNIRDGLDDYDEDFTNFEPLGDIITSDMKHRAEMQEKKRQEALAREEAERQEAEQLAADQELAESQEPEALDTEDNATAVANDEEAESEVADQELVQTKDHAPGENSDPTPEKQS